MPFSGDSMTKLDDMIRISDHSMKVKKFWDDRHEQFQELEMRIQKHLMDLWQQSVAIRIDEQKFMALRHARISLQNETRKYTRIANKADADVLRIEKDLIKITRLASPSTIWRDRIGGHWASLSKYVGLNTVVFSSSDGSDVFKKSIDNPYEQAPLSSMTASDFVHHCRTKALLVKPGTNRFDELFDLIEDATIVAQTRIEEKADVVNKATEKLHGILQAHWEAQGI
jgi:predicted peroxiredoxin